MIIEKAHQTEAVRPLLVLLVTSRPHFNKLLIIFFKEHGEFDYTVNEDVELMAVDGKSNFLKKSFFLNYVVLTDFVF